DEASRRKHRFYSRPTGSGSQRSVRGRVDCDKDADQQLVQLTVFRINLGILARRVQGEVRLKKEETIVEKISRRKFIGQNAVGAVSLYALSGSSGTDAAQSAPRLERRSIANVDRDLRQFIPRMMQHVGVPGLSIAVIRDGTIIWSNAFGVRNNETQEPVTTETPFEAASFSKAAFAYAVLKLCEQGKLSLDAPLWNYRPNYFLPAADPRSKLITTRMILSHTSGLQFRPDDKSVQIHSTPGEKWFYSAM